ncbi:hypothetical protein LMG33818_000385 [Halomonadaceae bacterium LMG 33818]
MTVHVVGEGRAWAEQINALLPGQYVYLHYSARPDASIGDTTLRWKLMLCFRAIITAREPLFIVCKSL